MDMKKLVGFVGAFLFFLTMTTGSVVAAERWWPSKWGPDDAKGALNYITPKKILEALALAREGKVYRLGVMMKTGMSGGAGRTYKLVTMRPNPKGGATGKNMCEYTFDYISGEISQLGTHLDSPCHIGIQVAPGETRIYNGKILEEISDSFGIHGMGVDKMGPVITRGVLIDVAALKGVKCMKKGEVITPEDIETCLRRQGIGGLKEGDAAIFRTGWINTFDNLEENASGNPGPGLAAFKYLIDKHVSVICADTGAVEVIPWEDPENFLPGHGYCLVQNGTWFLENLNLEELSKDRVYEFLFLFIPVPFKDATGSPGDAIAIK
jgi:kynurenine formamidase